MLFNDYLQGKKIPIRTADVRDSGTGQLVVTRVEHRPSDGIWYDPIDELLISIVIRSHRSHVVRDVGSGRHRFSEAPGCITITPPNQTSYWRFDGGPLVLHFTVPRHHLVPLMGCDVPDLEESIRTASLTPIYNPAVMQLGTHLWSIQQEPNDVSRALTRHALGTILLLLFGSPSQRGQQMHDARRQPELAPWRMKRVMELMLARLSEGVALDELAQSVGLSRNHFQRSFMAATGCTPYQRLSELRIEKAKKLLCETNGSMTEIGLQCGFASSAHFATRFKQCVGMSPTAWRTQFLS